MGGWVDKRAHYSCDSFSSPLPLARVDAVPGLRQPPVPARPDVRPGSRARAVLRSGLVGAQEVGETQVADLLHLAQGGAQLLRGRAVQPGRQLPLHGRPVAQTRGEHEGEAEARAVLRVELRQPEPLVRVQARQARASLLPLRLGAERAPLQLAARQVRVAAQDALLAYGEAQTRDGSTLPRRGEGARGCLQAEPGLLPRPKRASRGKQGLREVTKGNKGCPGGAGVPTATAPRTRPEPCAPRSQLQGPRPGPRGGAGSDKFVL